MPITTAAVTDELEVRPLPDQHRVQLTPEDTARRERGLTITCPAATCRAPAGQPCRYRDVAGIWREARLLHAIRLNEAARQHQSSTNPLEPATPATAPRRTFLARRAGRVLIVQVPGNDAAPPHCPPGAAAAPPDALQNASDLAGERPVTVPSAGCTAPVPAAGGARRTRNRFRAPSPTPKDSR